MKQLPIIAAVAFLLYSCGNKPTQQKPAPQVLPVSEIKTGDAITFQEYPASIEGTVDVEIRPQVEGILKEVLVDEGSYVKKGQPLFQIDQQPIQERLNNAKAFQAAAEGSLVNAALEVEKLSPLVQNKVVSEYQLKTAKAALQVAKAKVAEARSQVGTARINLGYTLIKAPVSGYIGRLLKKQGSIISPTDAQALTELSDVQNVRVYFALGEDDFINFKAQYAGKTLKDKIKNLPPVKLVLPDKNDYALTGKIDMIDGHFDKNTGSITLRASFPNTDGLLRSGNTGKIRLSLVHPGISRVPSDATIELQDKVFVYTVGDSNKVIKQPITIVGKDGNDYLVTDGVKKGQSIVLSGVDHLQDGVIIHPDKTGLKTAAISHN